MNRPSLIEANTKYYLHNKLKSCHEYKNNIMSWIINLTIFSLFFIILFAVLYFSRKEPLDEYEKAEKMRKEQEYVVSKIRDFVNAIIRYFNRASNAIKDNEKIFIKWLILLPIKTNTKDNKIPIKKIGVTFKLVKLKPCSVAMIFQIDKIHVRKKDEMIRNIARDLNFISPLSN